MYNYYLSVRGLYFEDSFSSCVYCCSPDERESAVQVKREYCGIGPNRLNMKRREDEASWTVAASHSRPILSINVRAEK